MQIEFHLMKRMTEYRSEYKLRNYNNEVSRKLVSLYNFFSNVSTFKRQYNFD